MVVATFGLGTALVLRWAGIAESNRRRVVVRLGLLSGAAVSLLVLGWLGVLIAIPSFVQDDELRSVAGIVSLTSFASIVTGLGSNVYRAQGFLGRFSAGTAVRVLAELFAAGLAVAVSLSIRELALWALALQTVVALPYGLRAYVSIPSKRAAGSAGDPSAETRSILRLGATLASAAVAQDVVDRADRLIVAAILGTAAVGIYSAAYAVASIVYGILPPFTAVLLPRLRDQWRERRALAVERLATYLTLFSLLTAFTGLVLIMSRKFVATAAVGAEEATAVAALTPLLVSAALVYVAGRLMYLPMLLDDNAKGYASSVAIAALANLILSPLLTYGWGLRGTASAALASYLVLGILSLRQLPAGERLATCRRSIALLAVALGALLL